MNTMKRGNHPKRGPYRESNYNICLQVCLQSRFSPWTIGIVSKVLLTFKDFTEMQYCKTAAIMGHFLGGWYAEHLAYDFTEAYGYRIYYNAEIK